MIAIPRHGYKPRQPSALRFSTADEFEVGNMSSEYNQHVIIRNGSGSSQASSEGSGSTASQQYHQSSSNHQQISRPTSYQPPNHQRTTRPTSYQPLNHQQTTRPTSYQPSGIQNNHNDNEGGSRSSYLAPGYAQPSRSNRSSYASKGFTYGVVESNQPPSPTPQRFYHSNDSQTKVSEFGDRSLSDARSGRASMLETTELADNSSIDYSGNPPEKAKRISRKLQKKAAT